MKIRREHEEVKETLSEKGKGNLSVSEVNEGHTEKVKMKIT